MVFNVRLKRFWKNHEKGINYMYIFFIFEINIFAVEVLRCMLNSKGTDFHSKFACYLKMCLNIKPLNEKIYFLLIFF